jgi:hypothetical protein
LCTNLNLDEHDVYHIQSLFSRDDFDWEKFYELANGHKIIKMLYSHLYIQKTLQPDIIPPKYINMLKQLYMFTLLRNKIMFKEIDNIATRFKQENIQAVFVKGPVLCEKLYKDLGLRSFNDFDIIVYQKDVDRAKTLLRDMGYMLKQEFNPNYVPAPEKLWIGHPHEKPMYRMGTDALVSSYKLELHRCYPYWGVDVVKMLDNAKLDVCGGVPIYTLSDIDHVIFLLCHIYQHLIYIYAHRVVPLNMFFETKECLRIACNRNGTQEFIARVHELNAQTPVYVSLVFINYIYNNFVSLDFLESVRPEQNLKNEWATMRFGNCDKYLPVTYEEMIFADRIKKMVDYNTRLKVTYGETVVLYIIDPTNISSEIAKDIAQKREDKHEMDIPQMSLELLDDDGMIVVWEAILSYFLPEHDSEKWHFFGGNLQEGVASKSLEELSMEYKIAWDMQYLYFYAKVNDSTVVVQEDSECDGVTLNFYQDGHLIQYGLFISDNAKAQVKKSLDYSGWKLLTNTKARTSCVIYDGKGYIIKAAIPWSELEIIPEQNKRFKFDIELVDFIDKIKHPDTILVWSGGQGFGWKYPDVFGEMILEAK